MLSEQLRAGIHDELRELAKSIRRKARVLSKVGADKDAARALALASCVDIWAKEWEPELKKGEARE